MCMICKLQYGLLSVNETDIMRTIPTNKLLLFIKTDIADLINKTVVKSEHDCFDFMSVN